VRGDIIGENRAYRTEIETDPDEMGVVPGNLYREVALPGPNIDERTVFRPRKLLGNRNIGRMAEARRWMHRFDERLPRIMRITPSGNRALILFATDPHQPTMQVSGIETSQHQIPMFGLDRPYYLRSSAICGWGTMSLSSPVTSLPTLCRKPMWS
jgi:hypothetical protein